MNIVIRQGTSSDLPEIFELIKELAAFEKALQEVTNTIENMLEDGFGTDPVYQLIVAEYENRIIGISIFYLKYSTWKGKGVFLEDIIVTENYRGNGIGRKLFEAVIDFAISVDAQQMHWQVLDWNEQAINFYSKYDATSDHSWLDCKLTKEQLNNFKKIN